MGLHGFGRREPSRARHRNGRSRYRAAPTASVPVRARQRNHAAAPDGVQSKRVADARRACPATVAAQRSAADGAVGPGALMQHRALCLRLHARARNRWPRQLLLQTMWAKQPPLYHHGTCSGQPVMHLAFFAIGACGGFVSPRHGAQHADHPVALPALVFIHRHSGIPNQDKVISTPGRP